MTDIGGGGEGSVPATKSLVDCLIIKTNRFVFTCLSNK